MQNFQKFIKDVKKEEVKSVSKLKVFKKNIKNAYKPVKTLPIKEEKQMIEYLVKQERQVKQLGASEQEEFNKFK